MIKKNLGSFQFVITIMLTAMILITTLEQILPQLDKIIPVYGRLSIVIILWVLLAFHLGRKEFNQSKFLYVQKEELLNSIMSYSEDAVYQTNINEEIILCNNNFCKFLNRKKDEIIGKKMKEFYRTNEYNLIKRKEAEAIIKQKPINYVICFKNAVDDEIYLSVIKNPIFDPKGNLTGILSICRDITAVKTEHKERDFWIEALTHDLKTPVTAQLKATEYLLKELEPSVSQSHITLIKHTISSCKFTQEMVNTILAINKFQNCDYCLHPSLFNVEKLVEEYSQELYYVGYNKNLSFRYDFSKLKQQNICADSFTIKRIISNLIFNAITYCVESSELNIILASDDQNFSFMVRNKVGATSMTSETLMRMFDRYAIAKNRFRQIGSGLGLYLTKKIVETYGGTVLANVVKDSDKNYDIYELGFTIPLNEMSRPKEMIVKLSNEIIAIPVRN